MAFRWRVDDGPDYIGIWILPSLIKNVVKVGLSLTKHFGSAHVLHSSYVCLALQGCEALKQANIDCKGSFPRGWGGGTLIFLHT